MRNFVALSNPLSISSPMPARTLVHTGIFLLGGGTWTQNGKVNISVMTGGQGAFLGPYTSGKEGSGEGRDGALMSFASTNPPTHTLFHTGIFFNSGGTWAQNGKVHIGTTSDTGSGTWWGHMKRG
jgi:hypothetical protein